MRNQPDRDPTSSGSEQREAADVAALDSLETTYATGDTLVLVDFPEAKQPYIKCNGRHWRATSFRVPSAALLGTGSTYFAKLYSPRAQARVRKHVDLAKFGEGIEYVLDLTPSLEGDDAAAQLIELSIPEGVRNWWLSMTRLGVSRFLVSGHDDHCPSHIDVPIEYESTEVLNKRDENLPRDNLDHIVMSQLRMVPDYCPVRHRANIIRLIRTILGEDLVLNSAIRVYTICGIAKQFDCASVIRDSVFTWLMAQPNSDFIDLEPEASLRIGWNLELRDVTRAAMRILVVEKTMDALGSSDAPGTRRLTMLGRPRTELPDELENIIQHATNKYSERVQQISAGLAGPNVFSVLRIKEWNNFMQIGQLLGTVEPGADVPNLSIDEIRRIPSQIMSSASPNDVRAQFYVVCRELLHFVHFAIDHADSVSFRSETEQETERNRLCYVPKSRFDSYFSIWTNAKRLQRRMLTDYWRKMKDSAMFWKEFLNSYPILVRSTEIFNLSFITAVKKGTIPEIWYSAYQLDLHKLHDNVRCSFEVLRSQWASPASLEVSLARSNHLALGLTDEEFKYLPLWAGGLDDGTGGVFQEEQVPDADMGPIGPGPAYHTGYSVMSEYADLSSSIAPSDAPARSMIGTEDGFDARTVNFDDTETFTSGRSKFAAPTGSTVTGTREVSSYAPSSIMTPSEGGSVVSAMARDVRELRLGSGGGAERDTAFPPHGIASESHDAHLTTTSGYLCEDTTMTDASITSSSKAMIGLQDISEAAIEHKKTEDSGDMDGDDGDDDDDWSAPSDDDGDLDNFR